MLNSNNSMKDSSNLTTLKTKLLCTCEKYTRIKFPYKYQKTVKGLFKNQNIVIMKQYKGRGVVIMEKSKCREKCLMILENGNLKRLITILPNKPKEKYNQFY